MNGTNERNRYGAQTPESLSTKLNRLSETARREPEYQFRNIAHLISVEMLSWSFEQLRTDAERNAPAIPEPSVRQVPAQAGPIFWEFRSRCWLGEGL
jgi:hypothetical protein